MPRATGRQPKRCQHRTEPEPHSDPITGKPNFRPVNAAESRARSVVDEARNGSDFGKLAITYSADQQALKGGQMGWGRIQELPGIFARALSTAKKAISSAQFVQVSASTS